MRAPACAARSTTAHRFTPVCPVSRYQAGREAGEAAAQAKVGEAESRRQVLEGETRQQLTALSHTIKELRKRGSELQKEAQAAAHMR